jgi:hypothetical protein
VRFTVTAPAPVPYLRCYCSICRKSAGGGGYAIQIGAKAATLKVEGQEHIGLFHAVIDGAPSPIERCFCKSCGTALWLRDPRQPDMLHPFASVIDTPLPEPPEQVHMMLGSKANWVRLDAKMAERRYDTYPPQSLEEWHRRHQLLDEG